MECRPDRVSHYLLDLHDDVAFQVNLLLRIRHGQVPLQLAIAQLVAGLILSIILRVFLHRIIDQMDEFIIEVWCRWAVPLEAVRM